MCVRNVTGCFVTIILEIFEDTKLAYRRTDDQQPALTAVPTGTAPVQDHSWQRVQ